MTQITRRRILAAGSAALCAPALAACGNGIGSAGPQRIEARVDEATRFMFSNVPEARPVAERSTGMLMLPLVTEATIGLGGAYGNGALKVQGATVDYYSVANASFGFQLGAQQYSQALFFMTPAALSDFRAAPGWTAGADLKYALKAEGGTLTTDTTALTTPVIAMVFGQAGLIAGASIDGQKYTRIIP
ncbi:twin-arginine translocation pathway signal [Jannaschia sp. Os4]|uniref:lipid-binding SYLF domain-containing protein n=1 Tax=Jannaschia sp. Os4 TaxID=2807617 RepID=UPI00193AB394|nr:YSC84-related protein [Jannaschia sp. Os4]MBM2576511.1 twin-arginine translocation pathway signal [Jannaschia sp. Os4]